MASAIFVSGEGYLPACAASPDGTTIVVGETSGQWLGRRGLAPDSLPVLTYGRSGCILAAFLHAAMK